MKKIKRGKEKNGKKNSHICICKHCTQGMATHQLVESNKTLIIERKMEQLRDV